MSWVTRYRVMGDTVWGVIGDTVLVTGGIPKMGYQGCQTWSAAQDTDDAGGR